MDKIWCIIPARKDSKGIKFKNRKLFNYTAIIIPEVFSDKVIVSSDDSHILNASKRFGFSCLEREESIAQDNSSMRDVLLDAVERYAIPPEDDVVLLYLTYPQRTWKDVEEIYGFYKKHDGRSLSCAVNIADHPYLCYYEKDSIYGRPVVEHELYRRQDYPPCFRQSLFVGIYKAGEISRLNDSLLCRDTLFFKLKRQVIDIDRDIDMKMFEDTE